VLGKIRKKRIEGEGEENREYIEKSGKATKIIVIIHFTI